MIFEDAARKLGRRPIGIDVTHLAIGEIEDRMRQGHLRTAFETIGVPKDPASAERLAADDPHRFRQWAGGQVGGYPRDRKGGDEKGGDGGVASVELAGRAAVDARHAGDRRPNRRPVELRPGRSTSSDDQSRPISSTGRRT